MIGIIAILGSPNTGKSTLFNRLTATRKALVANYSGVTRDRIYAMCDFDDQQYLLIDTGGFSDSEQELSQNINAQIEQAIVEAHLCLLVVDSTNQPSAEDLSLLQLLRKKNKPFVVLLNKCDVRNDYNDFYRYYQNFITISAEHGIGIQKLQEHVNKLYEQHNQPPPAPKPTDENCIRLSILGRPNVGKSTLINHIIGEQRLMTLNEPGTTRDVIDIEFRHKKQLFVLHDTPGIRRRSRVNHFLEKLSVLKSIQAAELSDVVLFIFDANEALVEQDLKLIELLKNICPSIVFAMNKVDQITISANNPSMRAIDRRQHIFLATTPKKISALNGNGVSRLLDTVIRTHEKGAKQWPTSLLNNILQKSLLVQQPPTHGRLRPKLKFIHQQGHTPPTFIIYGNQTKKIAANYQTFLQRTYRDALHLEGVCFKIIFKDAENPYSKLRKTSQTNKHK